MCLMVGHSVWSWWHLRFKLFLIFTQPLTTWIYQLSSVILNWMLKSLIPGLELSLHYWSSDHAGLAGLPKISEYSSGVYISWEVGEKYTPLLLCLSQYIEICFSRFLLRWSKEKLGSSLMLQRWAPSYWLKNCKKKTVYIWRNCSCAQFGFPLLSMNVKTSDTITLSSWGPSKTISLWWMIIVLPREPTA